MTLTGKISAAFGFIALCVLTVGFLTLSEEIIIRGFGLVLLTVVVFFLCVLIFKDKD